MSQVNIKLSRRIFNDSFLPYLKNYSNRYEIWYGGAGSGKSHFVMQKIILKAMQDKRKVLVVRKVANTLRDSVYQLALNILDQWKLMEGCKVLQSTMTITLPNGSLLLFRGLDNVEKLKSITDITDIVAEEFSELYEEDFFQLDLRLRANVANSQFIMMSNPTSKASFLYQHFFEKGAPADTFIHHSTYKDNKFLPVSYRKSLEALINSNPTWYRIYVLGEFTSLGKRVYTNWRKDFAPTDKTGLVPAIGVDFGYINDDTAILVSWVDVDRRIIYIEREYGNTGMLNSDIYKTLVAMGLQKERIVADSAEKKSIEEIKRLGIPRIQASVKGPDSVLFGIQKLQQFEIVVDPSCVKTIEELENYSYKKDKKTGEYINQPEDLFNHFLDALRYSIQLVDLNDKLQTMSKIGLGL